MVKEKLDGHLPHGVIPFAPARGVFQLRLVLGGSRSILL
jgi:hypothetical protein